MEVNKHVVSLFAFLRLQPVFLSCSFWFGFVVTRASRTARSSLEFSLLRPHTSAKSYIMTSFAPVFSSLFRFVVYNKAFKCKEQSKTFLAKKPLLFPFLHRNFPHWNWGFKPRNEQCGPWTTRSYFPSTSNWYPLVPFYFFEQEL